MVSADVKQQEQNKWQLYFMIFQEVPSKPLEIKWNTGVYFSLNFGYLFHLDIVG